MWEAFLRMGLGNEGILLYKSRVIRVRREDRERSGDRTRVDGIRVITDRVRIQ